MSTRRIPAAPGLSSRVAARTAFTVIVLAAAGCDSNNGGSGTIGTAPDPIVTANDDLPGVAVEIQAVRGGSGPGGNARAGDILTVDFTVARDDGMPLELANMTRGAIMVSGPTFNYQRVIASQGDVIDVARKTALGAYSYTFLVPLPAVYLEPLNDTTTFTAGEMTGQPLLAGTYTVGIELRKDYTIEGVTYRDVGNATKDLLLGDSFTLAPREVVTDANCNQCHTEVQAHGGNRNRVGNCLLCHTAGAEDGNTATVAGGTPDVTIDFRVLIHKIHAGKHLPSVNGVTTNPNGTRRYDATPKPYVVIGFRDSLVDYSEIALPVWPSLAYPMPPDKGYGALPTASQALEDSIRSMPVDCNKCHGDPDGDGPLPAPAQGDLVYSQPTRAACGSCHDDWNPEFEYLSNGLRMPPQADDSECKQCHEPSGTLVAVMDAHRHPLVDPNYVHGLVFDVQSTTDVGGNNNGRFDAGERIGITFEVNDGDGNAVPLSALSRIEAVLNGPTTNPNLLHYVRVPTTGHGAGPSYTINLPENVYYEPVGVSTGMLQTFATLRAPHLNVSGAATSLLRRTADGASSMLAVDAPTLQNFVDVTTGTGSSFAANDYIVIEDGVPGRREFLRIQNVQGDRLWFSSLYSQNYAPWLRFTHAIGSTVTVVTTASVPTGSYMLDATAGIIMETTEFGAGEILVSYTSDFLVPPVYPAPYNDSPDLGQSDGEWQGLTLLDGTYNLGIWGRRTFSAGLIETASYNEASDPEVVQLLFGGATTIQTVHRIDGAAACNECHVDIQFHGGGRRGVDTCLLCHSTAGAEDAPTYVYPAGPATPGVTVDFRTMLHKIHHGKELDAGASYVVAGFGGTGHSYEEVGFPAMPGGTVQCVKCHGTETTAWQVPAERDHPAQTTPTRVWRAACSSCHDSAAVAAHIDASTSLAGVETCVICHGAGQYQAVPLVHKAR